MTAAESTSKAKKAWRGFTLIELMVVLAIVGVIAAYAIPAYQNYLARTRVGEGLVLASAARLAVAENAASGAPLDSGFDSPPATTNVRLIEIVPQNGQIVVHYTQRIAPSEQTLVLVPSVVEEGTTSGSRQPLKAGQIQLGSLNWECFTAGKTSSTLPEPGPLPYESPTLPSKLAPAECRA